MIYFQIKNPIKKRKATELSMKGIVLSVIIKSLKFILPKANTDFDALYTEDVSYWIIEYSNSNDGKGYVNREVGFDKNNIPIVIGPYKDNYGFWTDSVMHISDFESIGGYELIEPKKFEKEWIKAKKNNKSIKT